MDLRLRQDLQTAYGLAVTNIQPLPGGWQNRLWRVAAQRGDLLVKQFSHRRYSRAGLARIEDALHRQRLAAAQGVPAPEILLCEGRTVRQIGTDISYSVMTFCPGRKESRETVTPRQLESLGEACARLHRAFAQQPQQVWGYPIDGKKMLDGLWDSYRARKAALRADDPPGYQQAILAQEAILNTLTAQWLDGLPKGLAHEDFAPDNLLFDEAGVTAVIDFDRNCYSFLWHDIGRCLLSFCLTDRGLDQEKTAAFVQGYARCLPLTMENIPDCLRVTWCIESLWWMNPQSFRLTEGKAVGFREDILWVAGNWFSL